MKVLLLKHVEKLGNKDEIIDVSPGYAKNALIPKKFAVIATPDMIARWEARRKKDEREHAIRKEKIMSALPPLREHLFMFHVQAGKDGSVFTSVHDKDIRAQIGTFLAAIDPILGIEDVHLDAKPIKELGEHVLSVRIGRGDYIRPIQVRISIQAAS